MNEQYLVQNQPNSSEKARKNGALGGIKSGESKRRKKAISEAMTILLNQKAPKSNREALSDALGIEEDEVTERVLFAYSLFDEAVRKRNVKAMELVIELDGGMPINKTEREKLKLEKEKVQIQKEIAVGVSDDGQQVTIVNDTK